MTNLPITATFRCTTKAGVEFTFKATLTESNAFAYGNRTCVLAEITSNGHTEKTHYDTRYEKGITKNFPDWVMAQINDGWDCATIERIA